MRWILVLIIVLISEVGKSQVKYVWLGDTAIVKTHLYVEDTAYSIKSDSWYEYLVYFDSAHTRKAYYAKYENYRLKDTLWYFNGQLKMIKTALDECHPCFDSWKWYPDGVVKSRTKCCKDSCVTLTYYHSGALKGKSIDTPDSTSHGNLIWHYSVKYYENGQRAFDPIDPNTFAPELQTFYYPSGQKKEEKTWIFNFLLGNYREWVENGQLKTVGTYETPADITKHVGSIKIGTWSYYNESGKLIKEEFYEEGKLVKTNEY